MKDYNDKYSFEIIDSIAEGGMGAVYKARQIGVEGFEKTVAIKTLREELSKDKTFTSMFIEEAKLVANLVHENIVQIYQLGKKKKMYYFVMEYVEGISLHDFINIHTKTGMHVPVKLAVFIASRIARGLAYAHSRIDSTGEPLNIVHRDICPNNVLINTEGLTKLTDFGIAKARLKVTDLSSALMGKFPYMSPEQANKEHLDFRSDIYSLGLVLFQLLAGETARNLDQPTAGILKDAKKGYVEWSLLPEGLDFHLYELLKKSLSLDPDERYQSTSELARDLEYYIYKDGYGPTIVSLADYMREECPFLYKNEMKNSASMLSKTDKFLQTECLPDEQ